MGSNGPIDSPMLASCWPSSWALSLPSTCHFDSGAKGRGDTSDDSSRIVSSGIGGKKCSVLRSSSSSSSSSSGSSGNWYGNGLKCEATMEMVIHGDGHSLLLRPTTGDSAPLNYALQAIHTVRGDAAY